MSGDYKEETMTTSTDLSDDLLKGAEGIGEYLGEPNRRRIFYMLETGALPAFKLAGRWYARKSRLQKRIEELEEAATG